MNGGETLKFVDTNVLVYAHDLSAGEKHARARDLITKLWDDGTGCVSIQVLQEFFVTVTQKVAKPLASAAAAQIISDLATWQVHCPGVEDVLDAASLQGRYKISFWDAMILVSATQMNCSTIWSEDLSDGQTYDGAVVTNPFVD